MISTVEGGGTATAIRQRRRVLRSRPRGDVDLSRDLHDHLSQTLNLLILEMELFKAEQVGREGVLKELDRIQGSIRRVLANVRGILHEARQDLATGDDLRPALKGLAERLSASCGAVVTVSVAQDWPNDLHPAGLVDLIRILEEAAHNSAIHGAPSTIRIELSATPDMLTASVHDDGRGMIGGLSSPGLGIRGMRERASLLGGTLKITSEIGKGTGTVLEIRRSAAPGALPFGLARVESA
jgi:two-component system, NarL family, sensor histidine kinase UhpB